MSDPEQMTQPDSERDQAISWLVRVQSDRATSEDWAGLTAWLEASQTHLAAFEEVERLSQTIDAVSPELLRALTAPPAEVVQLAARRPRRPPIPAWLGGALIAASVAAFAAPFLWNGYAGPLHVYRTRVGETRDVRLADGTTLRLDVASTLSARIGWGARRVALGDGEVSFDVAKDSGRPFLITVGDQTVRVVGTEFNIRHYDETTTVTVRRGVVEVLAGGGDGALVARLSKGWALRHEQGVAASSVMRVNTDAAFAWTQGLLICDDQPLPEIVAYLGRRFQAPIVLGGNAAKLRFSGVLQLGDEQQVTRDLARYLSLSEDRSGGQIVLR